MPKPLFLICVLAIPCALFAQNSESSWANLNTIQAGEKVQVVGINSKKVSGTFQRASDAAISLQEASGAQTIQRQDVRSVKLMGHSHRLRNALIAGGVGAGVGAVIGAAADTPCSSQSFCIHPFGRGAAAAIVGIVGFLAGAAVGALLPGHKTIYRVAAH
jgi:hypothetical protein